MTAEPAPAPAPAGPRLPARGSGPALAPAPAPALVREWPLPFPVDIALTISVHRHGGGDPTYRRDATGAIWRTSLTPDGPGTLRVHSRRPVAAGEARGVVTGEAWGPGAGWLLDSLPAQLGFHDDRAGFIAHHPVIGELALAYAGLRVGRSGRVFEALVPAVLEQKVVGREAHRAWRYLLAKFGTAAPGPAPDGMRVFPSPRTWARIPSWDWHRAGVEGVRARTIITAAAVAARLEQALGLDPAEADRRLVSLPGIGPWTSAEIRQRAMGDPDAVLGRRLSPTERGRLDAGPADHRRRRDAPAPGPLRRAPLPRDQAHRARRQPPPAPRPAHVRPRLPRLLAPCGAFSPRRAS